MLKYQWISGSTTALRLDLGATLSGNAVSWISPAGFDQVDIEVDSKLHHLAQQKTSQTHAHTHIYIHTHVYDYIYNIRLLYIYIIYDYIYIYMFKSKCARTHTD
jgi:hypothetical protein